MMQRTTIDDRASEMAAILARHAIRRAGGHPTVSVLIGEATSCEHCWTDCDDLRRRRRIRFNMPRPDAAVSVVATELLRQRDLVFDAFRELSRRTGRDATTLHAEWSARIGPERSLWVDRVGLSDGPDDHDRLCWLLLTRPEPRRDDPHERDLAVTVQDRLGWTPARLLGAICRLAPADELPVIACTWHDTSLERLADVAEEMSSLASAAPRLPIVLCLPPDASGMFLGRSHETRAITFLREGLVRPSEVRHERLQPPADGEAGSKPEPSDDESADSVLRDVEKDAARSAAERFLFETLEATPATTGLFALNVKLDFAFGGGRAAEIDLACVDFKLAIEVDGYYHFLEPESYRRDRRKDVELQRRGWLVMRFLADDVGLRQEEIVAAIVSAVEERRQESQG